MDALEPVTSMRLASVGYKCILRRQSFRLFDVVAAGKLHRLYRPINWMKTSCEFLSSTYPLRISHAIRSGKLNQLDLSKLLPMYYVYLIHTHLSLMNEDELRPLWACVLLDCWSDII
jgi:hypothetical protein